MSAYKVIDSEGVDYNGEHLDNGHVLDLLPEDQFVVDMLAQNRIALEETAPEAVPEEHSAVAGTGEMSESGVIAQGPFSVTITFKDGVTQEEQEAALPFIKTVTEEANSTDAIVPECINVVTITRL